MFRWFRSVKCTLQVQASRPVVEGLEGRSLMSATLLDTDSIAAAHAAGGDAGKVSVNDFHFVMKSGKVSVNDISFVMKVNKPSPSL